ncbi:MAG TPA: L,D-transpeptidase, partial [Polyangiaceae bacterium]
SGFAVVGSWSAALPGSEPQRLALLTNGRFVRAEDLQAAESSTFAGLELDEDKSLPLAFVVKRGIRRYKADGDSMEKDEGLDYHAVVPLAGRFRTVSGTKYWLTQEPDRWVRNQDVTIVHRRTKFPDFVKDGQRWLDVGVLLGTLVAYEGRKPVFATLVSTGRDRLGNPELGEGSQAVTKLGNFEILGKAATGLDTPPERFSERYSLFDVPWILEMSSGQSLLGAFWHDRFGIEHGPGDIMLSPVDARRLWQWATPELPKGWHAATATNEKTLVHVRK